MQIINFVSFASKAFASKLPMLWRTTTLTTLSQNSHVLVMTKFCVSLTLEEFFSFVIKFSIKKCHLQLKKIENGIF
jgi:hypothetical protein